MNSVYINVSDCVSVKKNSIFLKDILTIQSADKKITNQIGNIHIYTFQKVEPTELVVSVMTIIDLILKNYPQLEIVTLGETNLIVKYEPESKGKRFKEHFFTVFLCMVAFIGGGYTIMAYNTDVGAKELFNYLSMLFLGDSRSGTFCLSVTYAIGLTAGLLLFFNHLGNKKLTKEPTPLEVQMRLYERDVYTTIAMDSTRNNESL